MLRLTPRKRHLDAAKAKSKKKNPPCEKYVAMFACVCVCVCVCGKVVCKGKGGGRGEREKFQYPWELLPFLGCSCVYCVTQDQRRTAAAWTMKKRAILVEWLPGTLLRLFEA